MEIQINFNHREGDVCDLLDMHALITYVLTQEDVPETSEVALSFVDERTIHQLNRDYRNVDKPTDVLSFECDGFDDEFDEVNPDDPSLPFELGDIVISVDRAESQAKEYGLSFAEEMSLLITHGLLHLCGYDHLEDYEAHVMEAREEELLSAFWGKPFIRSRAE